MIGLHVAALDESCRWVAWDIDAHPGQAFDPEANFGLARRIQEEAQGAGLVVRLIDSDNKGGYHLWAPFLTPIPMADAFRLGRWLARHHAAFGFVTVPESFPKHDRLTGKRCGHWLRLPGRHHKRPVWSRVWSPRKQRWREGDAAIDALLTLTGRPVDVAAIVPAGFTGLKPRPPVAPRPERHRRAGDDEDRELRLAREALTYYANADLHYDDWLTVGMALRNLDDEDAAFELWDEWSARSAKSDYRVTAAKWASFQAAGGSGGIGLGTLFRRAMDAGWPGPAYEVVQIGSGGRRVTHRSRRKGTVTIPTRSVDSSSAGDH